MLDFLKELTLNLPGFLTDIFSRLIHGSFNERLEYKIAAILFIILAAFLFMPKNVLLLRRKILFALLFTLFPVILLARDNRMAATWPYFAFIAAVFIIIYVMEEIFLWRPLSRKRSLYYPTWLKPPERYKK